MNMTVDRFDTMDWNYVYFRSSVYLSPLFRTSISRILQGPLKWFMMELKVNYG